MRSFLMFYDESFRFFDIPLFISLLEQTATFVLFVFIISQSRKVRLLFKEQKKLTDTLILVFIFSVFTSAGVFFSVPFHGTLASTKDIGALSSGIFGGLAAGIISSAIGSLPVFYMTGWSGYGEFASAVFLGITGGLLHKMKNKYNVTPIIFGILIFFSLFISKGVFFIALSMSPEALFFLKKGGLPLVISSFLGILIFLAVVKYLFSEEERVRAYAAETSLNIAGQTIELLRKGLTVESAEKVTSIIYKYAGVASVGLTNTEYILAYHGRGSEHHKSGVPILTQASKKVIENGEFVICNSSEEIGCKETDCPLTRAIYLPLKDSEGVVGLLVFAQDGDKKISPFVMQLAIGLSKILSIQVELAKIGKHKELTAKAELQALQRQINPHFLFNSLNTIISFVRTDAKKARELLLKLSDIFRKTLSHNIDFTTVKEEITLLQAYLEVEKARFGERLKIFFEIDDNVLNFKIPSLILQPLVENSIAHGFSAKNPELRLDISAREFENGVLLQIRDNGKGINREKIKNVLEMGVGVKSGIGLSNVYQRLKNVYGELVNFELLNDDGGLTVKIVIKKDSSMTIFNEKAEES